MSVVTGTRSDQRRAREDGESCAALLREIPGIELVGYLQAPPVCDYDCGTSAADVERSRWLAIRDSLLEQARRLGADTLGIERGYPVDALGDYKRMADPDAIVEAGRAAWSSHGLSEHAAREIAGGYTWEAVAADRQEHPSTTDR
jgi:hypothetical protein